MADGFEVTPATLTTASSSLAGPAGDLRQKVSDVQSTVTSGNPWGSDEQGSIFGGLYTAVVGHAVETLASHADQLDYASQSLAAWGQSHEANDLAVEAKLFAVGGRVVSIELPGWLTEPFSYIGMTWPEADEDLLNAAGDKWSTLASDLESISRSALNAVQPVMDETKGDAAEAFDRWWKGPDGPDQRLDDDADAARLLGTCLTGFAALTVTLKLAWIAQLAILAAEIAQAVATAFVSFGATLAEVPGFAAATRVICRQALKKLLDHLTTVIKEIFERAKGLFKKLGRRDARLVTQQLDETTSSAYHYTFAKWKSAIEENGLPPGSYVSPDGTMTPLQAQIDLALPPNRGLPDVTVKVDLDAMRADGYEIPKFTHVSGVVPGAHGRLYVQPGGGMESRIPSQIPSQYLQVIRG